MRNGHGPCQDTCHNTWGNYTCSCVGLPGTVLAPGGTNCIDNGDCLKYNGGCSHSCITAISGQIYCLCPSGLQLSSDWKLCEGIVLNNNHFLRLITFNLVSNNLLPKH